MGQSSSRQRRENLEHGREGYHLRHYWQQRSRNFARDIPQNATSVSRNRRHSLFGRPTGSTRDLYDDGEAVPSRRRSRLWRARQSTSLSISHMFSRHEPQNPDSTHARTMDLDEQSTDESSISRPPRLPPAPEMDLNLDLAPPLSPLGPNLPSAAELRRSRRTLRDSNNYRISSLGGDRGLGNLRSLRRRRSPSRRAEDSVALISRLLSVAAAATAALLVGNNPENAVADLRNSNSAIDSDDGTFNSFLRALRSGEIGTALGQGIQTPTNPTDDNTDNPPSLEFLRMFRFGSYPSRRHDRNEANSAGNNESGQVDDEDDDGEHRMIPILIVGIRSLSGEEGGGQPERENALPAFLDALTNTPANINFGMPDSPTGLGAATGARPGVRLSQRRRASMGGVNLFRSTANRDRAQHPDAESTSLPDEAARSSPQSPDAGSPHNTPSQSPLSTPASETTAPSARSSFSSTAARLGVSPRRDSFIRRMTGTPLESTAEESPRSSQQRRASESDTPRLGSGSSRRNGVLMEPRESFTEGSRSWIIYILGGSYPENHPIVTTPSLFTDNPTYEDMLLLSSFIGAAKPPVASAEDVEAAPGLYSISVIDEKRVAKPVDGEGEELALGPNEQCLVCLCDYQAEEEVRKLVQCGHMFHRDCIDQWLTTGRNSCPLCRTQGVQEKTAAAGESMSGTGETTTRAAESTRA